jgi:hypothetical protein
MSDERADDEDAGPPGNKGLGCLRCGRPIVSLGVTELRTGGSTGATHFFLGQWAQLGEGKLRVEILACEACGHLEFRSAG